MSETASEFRATVEWNSLGGVYFAPVSPDEIVWECAACGCGAHVHMGYRAPGEYINDHLAKCPQEPFSDLGRERVEYMQAHGRPSPTPYSETEENIPS